MSFKATAGDGRSEKEVAWLHRPSISKGQGVFLNGEAKAGAKASTNVRQVVGERPEADVSYTWAGRSRPDGW